MSLKGFVSILQRLKKDKAAFAGFIIVSSMIILAAIGPFLALHDPVKQDLIKSLQPPNREFLLGTDKFGRDILSRILHGSRISLAMGLIPIGIGLLFGLLLGLFSGYYGGVLDQVVMRFMDLLLSFPYFLLALLIVATLGPGLENAMIAIGIGLIPSYARLTRGSVLSVKEEYFVMAAKAVGGGDIRIMFRHILPNLLTPLVVFSTLKMAESILAAAALSFIGLGAQPPTPEWGLMLNAARDYIFAAPHAVIYPGFAIVITVLGFNLLGDGLRDILDPRYRV
ncbi:MAG: ABC transporter permease [Candidatus Bathyarchaeia archaeon]